VGGKNFSSVPDPDPFHQLEHPNQRQQCVNLAGRNRRQLQRRWLLYIRGRYCSVSFFLAKIGHQVGVESNPKEMGTGTVVSGDRKKTQKALGGGTQGFRECFTHVEF
jgi:hypothetical protein